MTIVTQELCGAAGAEKKLERKMQKKLDFMILDTLGVESGHFSTRPRPLRRTLWTTRPPDLTPFFVA